MQTHAERSAGGRSAAAPLARSHAPAADAEPGALAQMRARANAGPHAASLVGLRGVVAQRACADCDRVRETMGGEPVQRAAAENRGGLPDGLRAGLESLSGRDLSGVRVHYGSPRPAQLAAHAYAQGPDIHLAPGQERHLPHEGWHAVQQMEGRVRPTIQLAGTAVNDDAALEREADVMGARAARMGTAQRVAVGGAPRAPVSADAPVQRVLKIGSDPPISDAGEIVNAARTAGATRREAAELARRATAGDVVHDDWDDALLSVQSLVFGTDGKNAAAIESAVQRGYRRFDCAESYRNVDEVADVLARSGLPRDEFEVIYKFNARQGESPQDLARRLEAVASLFGGWIDSLMIHNLDVPDDDIRNAWAAMAALKGGVAGEIGVGNVKPKDDDLLRGLEQTYPIEAIENSVRDVVGNDATRGLIRRTGAKLYHYGIRATSQEIRIESEEGIQALAYHMAGVQPRGGMILSSSDAARQAENMKLYGQPSLLPALGESREAELGAIHEWQGKTTCTENDPNFRLPVDVGAFLSRLLDPGYRDTFRSQPPETLVQQNLLPAGALDLRVPSRDGLKRKYLGMTLRSVLDGLFSDKSCDEGEALELIQMLPMPPDDWEAAKGFAFEKIV